MNVRVVVSVVWALTASVSVPRVSAAQARAHPGSDSVALAILARYTKAVGEGPVAEYAHWIDETRFAGGPPSRTEIFMGPKERMAVRMTMGAQVVLQFGFDGDSGWTITPGTGVTSISGAELASLREGITTLKSPPVGPTVRLVSRGKVMLEDEFTDLVLMIGAEGDTTEAYYAVASGLLSALIAPANLGMPGKWFIFFRDYKMFGGRQVATTTSVRMPGPVEGVTRMVHMSNDPIPDERFRRPVSSAPPDHGRNER